MDEFAELLGVASLIVMVAAVATGMLLRHRRALFHRVHKSIGVITLALAICHGLAMMLD
jgi:hypothetical protein